MGLTRVARKRASCGITFFHVLTVIVLSERSSW